MPLLHSPVKHATVNCFRKHAGLAVMLPVAAAHKGLCCTCVNMEPLVFLVFSHRKSDSPERTFRPQPAYMEDRASLEPRGSLSFFFFLMHDSLRSSRPSYGHAENKPTNAIAAPKFCWPLKMNPYSNTANGRRVHCNLQKGPFFPQTDLWNLQSSKISTGTFSTKWTFLKDPCCRRLF